MNIISPGRATARAIRRPGWKARTNSSRAVAALLILVLTPVLARAESISARAKVWIQLKGAQKAAEALADPNVTIKERLRVEQIYCQLARDNPQSAPAHNVLARFLWENGKPETAIEHWRTAQRLEPDNATTASGLGGAYLRMGRIKDAARQFLLAVRSESNNPNYHFDLANVEFLFRHDLAPAWRTDSEELSERALLQYREASRLAPTDREFARAYAETFYAMPNPDWKEAQVAWQHYLELSTNRNFAYLQLARVSLKRNQKAEALSFLDKISDSRFSEVKEKLRKQAEAL